MRQSKDAKKNNIQSQRFIKAARELGCDEDEAHFSETLKKVARHKPPKDCKAGAPKGNAKQSKVSR
jgi:hypothetical protein